MLQKPEFITVRNNKIIKRIELKKLPVIIGDSYCSTFMLENEEPFTCAKLLKQVEDMLPSTMFTRISRNTIINLSKVTELDPKTRTLTLNNGENYIISIRRLKQIIHQIETLN